MIDNNTSIRACMRCGSDNDLTTYNLLDEPMTLCKSCYTRIRGDLNPGKFVGISKIEEGVRYILEGLHDEFGLNLQDENFRDTPKRVARAYYEMCCGINCQEEIDNILSTSFPAKYGGMVVAKGIQCFSLCPHHLLPVEYSVNVGYIPKDRTIGLSKIPRIVELLAKAPKLQEDFTWDIVEALKRIDCKGVIVQVDGKHMCMGSRGAKQPNVHTLTSSIYGVFERPEVREEFQLIIHQ